MRSHQLLQVADGVILAAERGGSRSARSTRCPGRACATHLHLTRIFLPCAGTKCNAPRQRAQPAASASARRGAWRKQRSGRCAPGGRSAPPQSYGWARSAFLPHATPAERFRSGGAPQTGAATSFSVVPFARARVPSASAAGWRSGGKAGRGCARFSSFSKRIGPPPARRKLAAACFGARSPRCRCAPTATLAGAGA